MNTGNAMILSSWKLLYQNHAYVLEAVEPELVVAKISKDQFSAYTTLRTFNKQYVYRLQEHFFRLEQSAQIMGRNSALDSNALRIALDTILKNCSPLPDYRVRIYFIFNEPYGTLYIQVHDLIPPTKEAYLSGVRCITRTMQRISPKAKLTQFMAKADVVRSSIPEGIHEVIMTNDDGDYLEGISSNFYGVINGKVYTAEHGVLGGIVRGLVLDLLRQEEIPFELSCLNEKQIDDMQEAFITSSSRGILPVVEIDGHIIGDGKPGLITRSLIEAYTYRLEKELSLICV
jgi:branched-chain amino acid aminotransferase